MNYASVIKILCLSFLSALNINANNNTLNQKKFVIVTPSFNNIKFVEENLKYSLGQKYKNGRVIYYDDASTDGTGNFVKAYIKEHKICKNKIRLVINKQRVGPHENIYRAIHSCDNDEIIVIVDGDDHLADDNVLSYLNGVYADENVWSTYGQLINSNGKNGYCKALPDEVIRKNSVREYPWVTSHPKTFYAWLYKLIKIQDLTYKDFGFFPVCGDASEMYPIVEMSGFHCKFIDKVLYVYNCDNPLSYFKKWADTEHRKFVNEVMQYIRSMPRYKPLDHKI
ncbi:MAG: glycosyltransferase [Candidatus Babeliales bacterium]|jgi:glycosyltransferase involved in cell wall biosynthesis